MLFEIMRTRLEQCATAALNNGVVGNYAIDFSRSFSGVPPYGANGIEIGPVNVALGSGGETIPVRIGYNGGLVKMEYAAGTVYLQGEYWAKFEHNLYMLTNPNSTLPNFTSSVPESHPNFSLFINRIYRACE